MKKKPIKIALPVQLPPTLTNYEIFDMYVEASKELIETYKEQVLRLENGLSKHEYRKDKIIKQNENERLLQYIDLHYQRSLN